MQLEPLVVAVGAPSLRYIARVCRLDSALFSLAFARPVQSCLAARYQYSRVFVTHLAPLRRATAPRPTTSTPQRSHQPLSCPHFKSSSASRQRTPSLAPLSSPEVLVPDRSTRCFGPCCSCIPNQVCDSWCVVIGFCSIYPTPLAAICCFRVVFELASATNLSRHFFLPHSRPTFLIFTSF